MSGTYVSPDSAFRICDEMLPDLKIVLRSALPEHVRVEDRVTGSSAGTNQVNMTGKLRPRCDRCAKRRMECDRGQDCGSCKASGESNQTHPIECRRKL